MGYVTRDCDGTGIDVGLDECGCHRYRCEDCGFVETIHYGFCRTVRVAR